VDAIVVAAHFITALQTVVSRHVDPLESAVLSVGSIRGGARSNVIADEVRMEGTIRTRRRLTRRRIPALVKRILRATCSAFGAYGEFEYIPGYPAVVVDEKLTELVREGCREILGRGRVAGTREIEMGGEDFAYYAEKVPGTVIFIGVRNAAEGKSYALHHPRFDIDEAALRVGVESLAYAAYRYLEQR
jgi:amidohydrolase